MRITCDHSNSHYGVPVILDDDKQVVDYASGIKALRAKLSLSTQQLADHCGVTPRTVEGWEQGRMPEVAALNVMSQLINIKK